MPNSFKHLDLNTVMVIDDDQIATSILNTWLRKAGYTPLVYNNSEEALEVLRQPDSPNIIILDWVMPEVDGGDICHTLVKEQLKYGKYIIVASARDRKDDIAAALRAGADDYLTKPLDREEVFARVQVAQRTLQHIDRLRSYAEDLKVTLRRHNLQEEIAMVDSIHRVDANEKDFCQPLAIDKKSQDFRLAACIPVKRDLELVMNSFSLAPSGVEEEHQKSPPVEEERCMCWAQFITSDDTWVDVVWDLSLQHAYQIAKKVRGRSIDSDKAAFDPLIEIMHVFLQSVRGQLRHTQIQTKSFYLPLVFKYKDRSLIGLNFDNAVTRYTAFDGCQIGVYLFEELRPPSEKDYKTLESREVIAQKLTPTNNPDFILLTEGLILNMAHIGRIKEWVENKTLDKKIPVYTPTRVAEKILSRSGPRAVPLTSHES